MLVKSARPRVRLLALSIVAGLCLSLASAVTTSPAHADGALPYVPWSSYLPGWTNEYVPSSENDCVAGRSNCLKATLREMSQIADGAATSCGHDAVFARAYLRMTQLYGYTREIPGYYDDVRSVNHLDAVFAKFYFDAYNGWKTGNRSSVPQSWLIALDAAKNKKVTGSGELGEHQKVGCEGGEQGVDLGAEIVRQVVGGIHVQPPRERFGGRAEVGIDQLTVGNETPELEQDALGLQPLADGRGMEPGQRTPRVAVGRGPRRQTTCRTTPAPVAVADLAVEQADGGGERRAEPDGGTVAPGGRRHGKNVVMVRGGVNSDDGGDGEVSVLSVSCTPSGTFLHYQPRGSCSTRYRGGDPLSTESRVACGC